MVTDSCHWTALTLMKKKAARQARIEFVRSHPELRKNLEELAFALVDAKLYSGTCNPREVARYVGSLITEAVEADRESLAREPRVLTSLK